MKPRLPPTVSEHLFDHPRWREAVALLSDRKVVAWADGYKSWHKLPTMARDAGLDADLVWLAVKYRRMARWRALPLLGQDGKPFVLGESASITERLHRVDRETGGGGGVALDREHGLLADPETQRRFLIRSMMDEAIDSSIMEGARTSVRVARELLQSGRPPKNKDERMVANNYAAMLAVKARLERPLSPGLLLELHAILSEGALEDDAPRDAAGRFRRPGERVVVEDVRTNEAIYEPPPAEMLPQRIRALCGFANTVYGGPEFLHPIVKACVLHFMIGYEHPFADGNGRTARAIFYWSVLRCGYSIFEFLSISRLIREAAVKYPQAFRDTETDDNDLTYFVVYKLGVIERSLEALAGHLHDEERRLTSSKRLLTLDPGLNLRQRLLLEYALKHPARDFTARSQAGVTGVSVMTARSDLEHLVRSGLMKSYKVGNAVHYSVVADIAAKLADRSGKGLASPPGL